MAYITQSYLYFGARQVIVQGATYNSKYICYVSVLVSEEKSSETKFCYGANIFPCHIFLRLCKRILANQLRCIFVGHLAFGHECLMLLSKVSLFQYY